MEDYSKLFEKKSLFYYSVPMTGFYTNFGNGVVVETTPELARKKAYEIIRYKASLIQVALDNTEFDITVDIDIKESDIELREVKFEDILEEAKTKFFEVIFEYSKSGDISPDVSNDFDDIAYKVVEDMIIPRV